MGFKGMIFILAARKDSSGSVEKLTGYTKGFVLES